MLVVVGQILLIGLALVVGAAAGVVLGLRRRSRRALEGPKVGANLPAYVDPSDPASIKAWRETQTELDESW